MMKNFDVEKLERKNIYKTPDNFFAKVQENVLSQTTEIKQERKEGKVIKMNWTYAAAAAVAMIFGVGLFINQEKETGIFATEETAPKSLSSGVMNSESVNKPVIEEAVALQTLEEDIITVQKLEQPKTVVVEEEVSPKTIAAAKTAKPSEPEVSEYSETQIDQIISDFPTADFAVLGNNVEQDVYLDLYY